MYIGKDWERMEGRKKNFREAGARRGYL